MNLKNISNIPTKRIQKKEDTSTNEKGNISVKDH